MPTHKIKAAITKTSATNIQTAINIKDETFPDWSVLKLEIVDKRDGTKELVISVTK